VKPAAAARSEAALEQLVRAAEAKGLTHGSVQKLYGLDAE